MKSGLRVRVLAGLLLTLGLLQMAGDLLGLPALKGFGAATMASPAPKVFCSARGLETFSTEITLAWTDVDGEAHELLFDRAVYERLDGPYNRRNVYGAALAYGPVLAADPRTRPMLRDVLAYALTGEAPLLRELGIDPATVAQPMTLRFEPRPGAVPEELPCALTVPLR